MGTRILGWLALAATLGVAGTGCGGKDRPVKVEGVVTLDGNPVDSAVVLFNPVDAQGRQATGMTGSDGVFHLTTNAPGDGAIPGDYKVVVRREKGRVEWTPELVHSMAPPTPGGDGKVNINTYMESRG